jgi:hypothetical protein
MIMAYPSSFAFKDDHVPAAFAPSCHIFYGERSMDLRDDVSGVSVVNRRPLR